MSSRGKWERGIWPKEIVEYIRKNASSEITMKDMRQRILEKFGVEYTYDQVRGFYHRNGFPYSRYSRNNILMSDKQAEYMISIIPGRSSVEIAEMMNKKYKKLNLTPDQIRSWKKNHKIPSGYSGRFRPGNRSHTKGLKWKDFMPPESQAGCLTTCFKKGNIPKNKVPIGTITSRMGYLWIKVRDNCGTKNFVQLHRHIWEQANGPVPEGYRLFFLDGNPYNCKLENLQLVSAGVMLVANQKIGITDDPEVNKMILTAAELKIAVSAAEKRGKE